MHHAYHEAYDFFLSPLYDREGAILEIGTKDAQSIKMLIDLFPQTFIYGMDIGKSDAGSNFEILKGDQSSIVDLKKLNKN